MCSELLCPLCDISTFSDIESFKLNLIKVNSKPIKCPLCSEILLGLDKLTIHLFGHSLPFECESIKSLPQDETPPLKKIPKEQQQNIVKSVKMTSSPSSSSLVPKKDENFRCEICGFLFVEEQLLNLHLSLVHNFTPNSDFKNQEIKKWVCHLCGKNFKMKGALRIHVRVAHVRFHDQNQRQINIADYLRSQKTSIDMCTKQAEMLSLKDPYSPQNSPQYNVTTAAARSPLHQEIMNPIDGSGGGIVSPKNQKTFQCEECKKTFTTKYFLKKHRRLHTGEYPYSCNVEGCGKMFHFQQSYHKHLLYHSDAKPYECSECGRSFKELSTLNNHQRIHSGIKPFGCHCGKFFRQKVSYLVHQRIHNGSLPYKCSECGKGFRYKVSQRSHKCNGTIERQPGTLIQKLMQNSLILPNAASSTIVSSANANNNVTNETPPTAANISISNQTKLSPPPPHETSENNNSSAVVVVATTAAADEHELCLDEFLEESYEKLMKVNENENQLISISASSADNGSFVTHTTPANNNNATSGMMFENHMAINSNYGLLLHNGFNASSFHSALETINEDSIKDLLYGHVG